MSQNSVRIPASLNEEDVFLSYGPIKLSMRQLCVATGGLFVWFGVAKYFLMPLTHLTMFPALLGTVWVAAIFFALAFVKVQQRPIDQWIGDKLNFQFGTRTYVLRESGASRNSLEADMYSDDALDAMLESVERTKAY
jgi:hypothetical protein